NALQAREAVKLAKFYPQGERGMCRFVRAAQYSTTPRQDYFAGANDALVIVQLEGTEAIANIEEILDVPGIDIAFIGPYDLSQSLGLPGQTTHPKVLEAMQRMIATAKKKGVVIGTFTDTFETMKMWMDAGVQYISYSVDVGIFAEACRSLVNQFECSQDKK
ncbi:MAG: aldolase/citrate lyase family protein, partial [Ruthenibacterium sp.]